MEKIVCTSERHPMGGGRFLFGRSELLCGGLCEAYANKVQLIYLDPPFGTGSTFSSGGGAAYRDDMPLDEQLGLMRTILTACYDMLAPSGSIYLHIDYRLGAHLKLLLDEIFGRDNFVNEIIWAYRSGGRAKNHFSRKHDTILFYRKSRGMYFNIAAVGSPRGPERRNHMKRETDPEGRVFYTIRTGGKTYAYYEDTPVYPSDVWDDIEHLHQRDPERTGYGTQKPEALLERIILASSREGDTVMDLFSGSGTTAIVSERLDRRWIAADSSPTALLTLRARMLRVHRELTLFSGMNEMRLEYPALPVSDIASSFRVQKNGQRVKVELADCPNGGKPAYLAVGRRENDVFLPLAYSLAPRAGSSISASIQGAPVVQLCDADGGTAFFEP